MGEQTQIAGNHSNQVQADTAFIGDNSHVVHNIYLGTEAMLSIFAPDRRVEGVANGMFYHLRAKQAVVFDTERLETRTSNTSVVESKTTIWFLANQGEPFSRLLPKNHERLWVRESQVMVVDAFSKNDEWLSRGVLAKGIGWKHYEQVPFVRYWRLKEFLKSLAVCLAVILIWYLKVHFGFYYGFNQIINTTEGLVLLTSVAVFTSVAPALKRQTLIDHRMREFAEEVSFE